jgi:hypothetical protein
MALATKRRHPRTAKLARGPRLVVKERASGGTGAKLMRKQRRSVVFTAQAPGLP